MDVARIAVIGPTGSGKSKFINDASGSRLEVGNSMMSCTARVQESCQFKLVGSDRGVILIDTPGLDATARSDVDVEGLVVKHLQRFPTNNRLSGVIYLHRISDPRMGSTHTRNVRKLFKWREHISGGWLNIVVATTLWDHVDKEEGEFREKELQVHDAFVRIMECGASMMRQDKGKNSAHLIISEILQKEQSAVKDSSSKSPVVKRKADLIAVMGPVGSGKTKFINDACGLSPEPSHSSEACTKRVSQSRPFRLPSTNSGEAARDVILIDTPWFDNPTMSDVDILHMITRHLQRTYRAPERRTLSGIIYMHRISDRMDAASTRYARVFYKLCGKSFMSNVVFATTCWDKTQRENYVALEEELGSNFFFRRALSHGANMMRHDSVRSAHDIIRRILSKSPQPLRIQKEMVDRNKALSSTNASQELYNVFQQQLRRLQGDLRDLREAQRMGGHDSAKTLEDRVQEIQDKIALKKDEQNAIWTMGAWLHYVHSLLKSVPEEGRSMV